MPPTSHHHHSSLPSVRSLKFPRSLKFLAGTASLLAGCLIYLSWRDENIRLYVWSQKIGLGFIPEWLHSYIGKTDPGAFVRNSLPDGLYCMAYMLIMDALWERESLPLRMAMALLIPALAIIHEILQCLRLVPGTFDTADLLCYIIPVLTYLIYIIFLQYHPFKNR